MAQSAGASPLTGSYSDLGLGAGDQLAQQVKETLAQRRKRLLGLIPGSNVSPAVQSLFGPGGSGGSL
jgi:hypothetical protein